MTHIDTTSSADIVNGPFGNTPNVVISNPNVRQVATVVLSTAGVILTVTNIIDAAVAAVDWSTITNPASQILLGLTAVFIGGVTVPNIPTK